MKTRILMLIYWDGFCSNDNIYAGEIIGVIRSGDKTVE